MLRFIRNHRTASMLGGTAVAAALAWLAFGYFGVHTLFVDDEVAEAIPVFDAPTPADSADVTTTAPVVETSGVETSEVETSEVGTAATVTTPQIVTEFAGEFVSRAHPTAGRAVVLGNGTGQRFLRFEDFETDNGPDLNVYLVNSSTGDVSDYIDLGDLKGNIGEQNYEIPADVDLDVYDQVSIWCVRFGVAFGDATLAAAV